MAESGLEEASEESEITSGEADAASNVMEDVSAQLRADVSESTEASANVNKLTENRLKSVDTSLEKIKTKIGLEGTVEDTIIDIENGQVTVDTVKFKNWYGETVGKISDSIKETQAENDEAGRPLKDSPKTIKEYMKKYGDNAIAALLVLGIILSSILIPVSGASQCFQMPTCGTGGPITPINCSKQYCNCTSISSCGSYPACNQPATNCMYYYYQTMDAKTIIATLPYIAYTTYLAPQPPKSETLKKILILLGILIIGCAVIFMIYKLSNK